MSDIKFKTISQIPTPIKPGDKTPEPARPVTFLAITEEGELVRLQSEDAACTRMTLVPVAIEDKRPEPQPREASMFEGLPASVKWRRD